MENRFYKSRNINELSLILAKNGFTKLDESITDPLRDKALIFDSKKKTYFIISEDLLGSAESQITEGLDETLHDYDKLNAEHFQPKQDSPQIEGELVDKQLRDQFAGIAMQGELSSQGEDFIWNPEELAVRCYAIADAMLKARNDKS